MSTTGPFDGDYDVAIVGGGPAGSTLGTLLAQDGLRVVIFERERMPRPHVGESLIPGALPALDTTGVLERVEQAGFTQKHGATFVWGRGRNPWTIRFSEVEMDRAFAFQVDRPKFDQILLDYAREQGVVVHEDCQVTRALGSAERVTGLRVRAADGQEGGVSVPLTVDASGQAALLGRQFRQRDLNKRLNHIALYGHWRGGRTLPEVIKSDRPLDAGNIFIVAVDGGWIWHIPLAGDVRSVGLVTDPSVVRGVRANQRTALYLESVRACDEMRQILDGAEWLSSEVVTLSDWSFFCRRFHGPGYLLIGDAAGFVDPILSAGVTLALNGALRAARAIRTSRAIPRLQSLAMDWYEIETRAIGQDFADLAEHWYGGNRDAEAWFWSAKRLADPTKNLSVRQAFVYLAAGISGVAGAGGRLRAGGGYSPRQLQMIYENLDVDLDEAEQAGLASITRAADELPPGRRATHSAALAGRPDLDAGISHRTYVTEHEDRLRPITRVTRLHPNAGPEHIELPAAAASVLGLIDGNRSGTEIADILGERLEGSAVASGLRDFVATTLTRLAEVGAIALK